MNKVKRIIIATLSGLGCGFICYGLASSGEGELALPIALQIISSRTLMGFAIGISLISLKHWSIHGIVMGLVFSIPLALGSMMAPENQQFSKTEMFISTLVIGMIYGLLVEIITSLVFKVKQQK